jgi:DNA topoisomerase-1
MKLIVTEKNQTASRIAAILSGGKATREGGQRSTVYAFSADGEDVVCIGLRGHILKVDFPEEYRQWQDVEPSSLLTADILKSPTEKALVATLKKLATGADSVVIATDFDREGELIGSDALSLIREVNSGAEVYRARFSALTTAEIKEAFAEPDHLNENLARAGEARQDIDLIWGAALTRFISLATMRLGQKFLSVGRVQSPTLALVVDRERDIQAFKPEDFWVVRVTLDHNGEVFAAQHATERFKDEGSARTAYENIGEIGTVTDIKTRERLMNPPPPFNTTGFLTAASSIRIPPARAMEVAESLYTRGIISYPRVDNTVYPKTLSMRVILESIADAETVGPLARELLQRSSFTPTRGKKFATDHPPIHPTDAASTDRLSQLEWKVYELVARRFLATLADAAEARSTRADLDMGGEPFVARGDVIESEGYLRYYPYFRKKDEELPRLERGDRVRVVEKQIEAKQTQPPPRYNEGRLIEKMEELGLGTKSTRHSIIQNLIERGYIFGSPLRPSETGNAVASALERHANLVTTPDMTAQLEKDMDLIVEGEQSLESVVDESRDILGGILEAMEREKSAIAGEIRAGIKGDLTLGSCPSCAGELRIKKSMKTGRRFAGCGNYPECETAYPLPPFGMIVATGEICEHCGSPRIRVLSKGRRPWDLCLDPACPSKPPPPVSGKKAAGKRAAGKKAAGKKVAAKKAASKKKTGKKAAGQP